AESLRRHESEQIRLLDWVSGRDLDELLCHAAIFVLPSDLEGLSLAMLDAMAAGVCVLASDIPENQEAVTEAGFTFKRGSTGDLARVLEVLLCNPGMRQEAAAKAKQRVQERYLWPDIAQSIEKVYYGVVVNGQPRHGVLQLPSEIRRRRSGLVTPRE